MTARDRVADALEAMAVAAVALFIGSLTSLVLLAWWLAMGLN